MQKVTDLNVAATVPLPSPECMAREIAPDEADRAFVAAARREIHQIIFTEEPRFLLVIGPCSIHDVEAGREYAERLARLAREVADRIFVVMRVYFEKPRTTIGWKGLIMDPHLDGSHHIEHGLRTARRFLLDVVKLGLPTATELLDPITPQYIADLICWSAIGARTSESQTHRQMASGLSMPLGFKNATPGTLEPAINAIKAARSPQTFLGVDARGVAAAVTTSGNPNCHIILRGGDTGPNYSEEHVEKTRALLAKNGFLQAIMIDASHGNCGKDYRRQPEVFAEIVRQAAGNPAVIGAMVESNLVEGRQAFPQPLDKLVRGQSITDPCIGWETTERIVREAHAALAPRFGGSAVSA
ncbi:MAG: 3-deoxy-7-phosphoheptulonate synthase [Kiritimatiellia bacterium]